MKAIKRGDYVHPLWDRFDTETYYVLGASKRNGLHLEDTVSGNSWGHCDPANYEKCKKPKSFKQEHEDLCDQYSVLAHRMAFKNFSKDLVELLRKHGDNIHNL